MRSTPYSWTDYGFTLKNWRSSVADTLVKTAIFIALLTVMKWIFGSCSTTNTALCSV